MYPSSPVLTATRGGKGETEARFVHLCARLCRAHKCTLRLSPRLRGGGRLGVGVKSCRFHVLPHIGNDEFQGGSKSIRGFVGGVAAHKTHRMRWLQKGGEIW